MNFAQDYCQAFGPRDVKIDAHVSIYCADPLITRGIRTGSDRHGAKDRQLMHFR